MEELFALVMDDDNTPIKKIGAEGIVPAEMEGFLVLDVLFDPDKSYNRPSYEFVKELCAGGDYYSCKRFYLPKSTADVRMIKIIVSACFAMEVAPDNMKLRVCHRLKCPTNPKRKYEYVDLDEDNQKLGENPWLENNQLTICVSKKIDRDVWKWYFPGEEVDDYDDARMLLEDEWLVFVTQNWKTINDILSYNERVWHTGGEKKKFDEECQGKSCYMKNIQQMERRRQRLYDLQESILKRQRDESDSIHLERHHRMYAKYFHPKSTRTV
jgi:hypothetical protein